MVRGIITKTAIRYFAAAGSLFNRCKALTIQNTSRDSDGLFFQHMERPRLQGMLLYGQDKRKKKKNVTAVARLLQPTMAL